MKFIRGKYPDACVPTCLAMILGKTDTDACILLKGHYRPNKGTQFRALNNALNKEGIKTYICPTPQKQGELDHRIGELLAISQRFPVAISVQQKSKTVANGTSISHHCIVFYEGEVWDPARTGREPINASFLSPQRKTTIKDFIVAFTEEDFSGREYENPLPIRL